jgi:glutamate-5-semialdehyde dehydrogenase
VWHRRKHGPLPIHQLLFFTIINLQSFREELHMATTLAPTVNLDTMGRAAKLASRRLAALTPAQKNAALEAIAVDLERHAPAILEANAADVANARARGVSDAMLDRLMLTPARVQAFAADTRGVAALPDPVGAEIESRVLPNGMRLSRRRTSIGVLGVIYESRPNVTIDIAVLCIKTGNAVILRGGSDTLRSSQALVEVIRGALARVRLPVDAVQYIVSADRTLITELLRLDAYVDMIIPRGGAALHKLCREQATVPVITGGVGSCHLFVDTSADIARSIDIIVNAKTQRPGTCNTLDTVLVHRAIAKHFLPPMAARLAEKKVELRADSDAYAILQHAPGKAHVLPAGPDDFDQEWLSLILGVRIVDTLEEAIDHIQEHSLEHTDGILTNDWQHAMQFVNEVNSSAVFVNASTRFNDGGQFGLGAEVAVSTQKLHARGPMGLEQLTTYKWVGLGDWHVRP